MYNECSCYSGLKEGMFIIIELVCVRQTNDIINAYLICLTKPKFEKQNQEGAEVMTNYSL